jgi:hypothetical protein
VRETATPNCPSARFLYGAWHTSGQHAITALESEGINTLILLIGSIYAVIFGFVIYVIWGQFTDVENFMMRECKSLNELLRFSAFLAPDAARSIRRAVGDYLKASVFVCVQTSGIFVTTSVE